VEEDVISILDEALLDPDIVDAINAKLGGSGVTLRILEVETYEEDECAEPEDEMAEMPVEDEMAEMPEHGEEAIDDDEGAIEEVAAK